MSSSQFTLLQLASFSDQQTSNTVELFSFISCYDPQSPLMGTKYRITFHMNERNKNKNMRLNLAFLSMNTQQQTDQRACWETEEVLLKSTF